MSTATLLQLEPQCLVSAEPDEVLRTVAFGRRFGNEYITRHLPVKSALPQYEWVEPPTGPQHPGVVFVPPSAAQLSARNSPRSMGMNYPMAVEKGGFPGRTTASR